MITLLLRFGPYAVIVLLTVLWYADHSRAQVHIQQQITSFNEYQRKSAEALAAVTAKALEEQQKQMERANEISRIKREKDQRISVLERDVRNRTRDVRLCRASRESAAGVSKDSDSSTGGDSGASADAELSQSAVPDIVTLAADADRVVSRLEACQDFVRSLQ